MRRPFNNGDIKYTINGQFKTSFSYTECLQDIQRAGSLPCQEIFDATAAVNPFFRFHVDFPVDTADERADFIIRYVIHPRVDEWLLKNEDDDITTSYKRGVYKAVLSNSVLYFVVYQVTGYAFKTSRQLYGWFKSEVLSYYTRIQRHSPFDDNAYTMGRIQTIYSGSVDGGGRLEPYQLDDGFTDEMAFVGNVPSNHRMFTQMNEHITGTVPESLSLELVSCIVIFVAERYKTDAYVFTDMKLAQDGSIIFSFLSDICLLSADIHQKKKRTIFITKRFATYKCNDNSCASSKSTPSIPSTDYPTLLKQYFYKPGDDITNSVINVIREKIDTGVSETNYNYDDNSFVSEATALCRLATNPPTPIMKHIVNREGLYLQTDCGKLCIPCELPSIVSNHFSLNLITIVQGDRDVKETNLPIEIFDDPTETMNWNNALSTLSHRDIAELFAYKELDCCWDETSYWVCANNVWISDISGKRIENMLSRKISNKLTFIFSKLRTITGDHTELKERLFKMRYAISTNATKRNIINELAMLLLDEEFLEKLDKQDDILPFKNGVVNLDTLSFGPHMREYYVSITTGYNWDESVDVQMAYTFMKQIMPNPALLSYLLFSCGQALDPRIPNNKLLFLTAPGSNGKSLFITLFLRAFGNFATSVSGTLFTRKEVDANNPTPSIAKLRNKRACAMAEIEADGSKIQNSIMKKMTGNDEISARFLRKDDMKFFIHCKFFITANEMPSIDGNDLAIGRRVQVIRFPMNFVDEPVAPNDAKMDEALGHIIRSCPMMRMSFMKLILRYLLRNIPVPPEVRLDTRNYLKDNDEFTDFLRDNIKVQLNSVLRMDELLTRSDKFTNSKKDIANNNYKKKIDKYITEVLKISIDYDNHYVGIVSGKRKRVRGWKNVGLINDDDDENIEHLLINDN